MLAEAERAQVLEVWPDAVAFRHELARRAVEGALPVSVRMRHNARVLAQLLAAEPVDLPRVVHHAVAAGDDAVVVAHAPRAAERRGGQSRSWPRTATRPARVDAVRARPAAHRPRPLRRGRARRGGRRRRRGTDRGERAARLGRTIHGRARFHLGDDGGFDEMVAGVATAAAVPHHQNVLMGQISLVQELWLRGRYAEVEQRVEEAVGYGREHDLDYFVDYLLVHRHRLQALRGDWATAEAGLRARLAAGENGSGSGAGAARHALPALAQLLVRRGAEDAHGGAGPRGRVRQGADSSYELVPALLAEIEQAWLLDRPAAARAAVATLDERTVDAGCGTPARRAADGGSGASASRSRRSPAVRTSWRRASAATGGRPPRRGRRSATRTPRRWSWPRATPTRAWPPSPASTNSAPARPPRACGATCADRASR